MGNIKKQNSNGKWDVLASSKATGISVVNSKLLEEGESMNSVDRVLERHQDAIDKLQHNVSWLAKHGGGGSGGSGGGGSDVTEATCDIAVNDNPTGSSIVIDENGLKVSLNNISVKATKAWTVTIRIGASQVATASLSFTSNTFYLALNKISPYLINHTGNLTIGASYEDETNGIYGSATWTGTVLEAVVNIKTSNYQFNSTGLDTAQVIYNYSVGIVGTYTMSILVEQSDKEVLKKEYPVTINSTSSQVKAISLSELFEGIESSKLMGVFNITTTLSYDSNPLVSGSYKSTLTIVSDAIMIATTVMSESKDSPVEVSLSSSINLVFTAYLQSATTYKYSVKINNTIVKQESTGYFGTEISDFIPLTGDWAVEDAVVPVILTITSGSKSATKTYYVKLVKSLDTFLNISDDAKSHLLCEFLSRNYNTGDSTFNIKVDNYEQGGNTFEVSSTLNTLNGNDLSVITKLKTGLPYLRLSNAAYANLHSFSYNNKSYNLSDLLITKAFTISLCFKADYHPDDGRTILFCGDTDSSTGKMLTGISIDVHDVYINNESVTKLTDNTINFVDITCQPITTEVTNDKGEKVEVVTYIVKIYIDGVLTSVSNKSEFIDVASSIYFGARIQNDAAINLCDCNIYNFQLYDTALTDFDIMINYINNKVSTTYVDNQPDFSIIAQELKTNFCSRESDGSIKSNMYVNGAYTIDFLLDATSHLSIDNLNSNAKVLGIPIMLIDVSTDADWTFNTFVTQQSAGKITMDPTSGKTIQYWDPNGNNTSIVTLKDTTIELQGTSTLSDSIKNLNITVPSDTVFVPKDTWFPEQTYTLKADVVDSSHSNNAAIGSFINEKLGYDEVNGAFFPFDETAIDNVYNSDYKKKQQKTVTLKHTVEGFPILLIMKFSVNETSTISVAPLGIYSFNLGRDAYRNLGFRKVTSISDSTGNLVEVNTFPYLLEKANIKEKDSDANWIEIADTSSIDDMINVTDSLPEDFDCPTGDFWQDDPSILKARYKVKFGSKEDASQYENFRTFVKNIMLLPIEGCSTTDITGTRDEHRITGSYDKYKTDGKKHYIKTGEKNTFATDSNTLPADLGFNADSFYKYFVIGLLFGLVDNFGKNSTYRSWGGGQYYIDFYDLDTALKGDNQAALSVGPDLWIKYLYNDIEEDKKYGYICESFNKDKTYVEGQQVGSSTVVSANHNKVWLSLDTAFFRGYSGSSVQSVYTQYWYQLRVKMDEFASAAGYTDFADYFINEFYIKQTKSCGPLLFNYDYKLKYLLQFTGDSYTNTGSLNKLHGRKIAIARDWLKKHINFLDSLFYWRDNNQALNFRNDLNSRGSNTVLNTPESFPITTNSPLLIYNGIGDTTKTFYFMQANTKTYVNTIKNASNSALTWNISNSPNIIALGDSDTPLSSMNIRKLEVSTNNSKLNDEGYPSITSLLLSNNKSFVNTFSLNPFAQSSVSELRTIDLSNTSGESFSLDLVNTLSDGTQFTKFTKLTSINISNSSCVSNLSIPTIPLKELVIRNSAITNFNFVSQKYIQEVDLTGCTRLVTINISKCDSYKKVELKNLTNLKSVSISDCGALTSVTITNCPKLTSIKIEYCDQVSTIQITSCSALVGGTDNNYVRIANCNNIESLKLSSNLNLKKVILDGCDRTKIKTLDIQYTNITDMSGNVSLNSDMKLDLREFTNLTKFYCYYNKSIKAVAFANNKDKPIPIINTFQECPNLERIYGCVSLKNASTSVSPGLFYGCTKFSVHGTSISKWHTYDVKSNNRWRTPWEMIKSSPSNYSEVTWEDTFVAGDNVTNIKFSNNTSLFDRLFYNTSVTQFDVYYILCVFALSNVTYDQNLDWTFCLANNGRMFDWASGNYPNRYMFYGCSKITSLHYCFSNNATYLCSPTIDDSGNVTEDNGLFSPLTNLNTVECFFSCGISKYLFRRKEGKYPIATLQLAACRVYDSDDLVTYANYTNTNYLKENYSKMGNLDGFFDSISGISKIYNCFSHFINFDTVSIPTSVTEVFYSFNCPSGKGTIDLRKMFTTGSKCTKIVNSFRIAKDDSMIESIGSKVAFPIANDTFKNLLNIVTIGYDETVQNGGNVQNTSFSGQGLNKYIEGSEFPFDITSALPNLEVFAGFFKEVTGTLSTAPAIPGNMFKKNTKLKNVAALMYNADIPFTLSGDGFSNCPKLNNVGYFCYHSLTSDVAARSKLTGCIPYHLFYHGKSGTTKKTYYGTNQEDKPDENFDTSTLLSDSLTFPVYNSNINNMQYCFYGCINLEEYKVAEEDRATVDVEANEYYSPYKWMYNSANKSWSEGTLNTKKIDASWSFDGDFENKNEEYDYLDDAVAISNANIVSDKNEDKYYMCPTDLFRYCNNNSSLNLKGIFYNCGLNYSISAGGNKIESESLYNIGIKGRIPPNLLRPVSKITSIDYLFKNCRCLYSYKDSEGKVYQIPKNFFKYTPNITSLCHTFSGMVFQPNTVLSLFDTLSKTLDIRGVFSNCIWGKSSISWTIQDVFSSNRINKISGAFSLADVGLTESTYGVNAYTNTTFTPISEISNNFGTKNTNIPSATSTGYVYYGWGTDRGTDSLIANNNYNYK